MNTIKMNIKITKILVISVVLVFLLLGCKKSDKPAISQVLTGKYKVSGRVLSNGVGLQGATVTLSGLKKLIDNRFPDQYLYENVPKTQVTGPDGAYAFTDLPEGKFYVVPSLEGASFSPTSAQVNIKGADERVRDFIYDLSTMLNLTGFEERKYFTNAGEITGLPAWNQNINFRNVAWSGSKYVATAHMGGIILSSNDGKNWKAQVVKEEYLGAIATSGKSYIIGGKRGKVFWSADGENWEEKDIKLSGNEKITDINFSLIIWGGGRFLALDTNKPHSVFDSQDGITWHSYYNSSFNSNAISWNGKEYLVWGSFSILRSIDAKNWVEIDGSVFLKEKKRIWTDLKAYSGYKATTYNDKKKSLKDGRASEDSVIYYYANSGKVIVGTGRNGLIVCSDDDGKTWNKVDSGSKDDLHAVIWANGKFFVVGYNGFMASSVDGRKWVKRTSEVPVLESVAWSGASFVTVGQKGVIYSSEGGLKWTARYSGTKEDLLRVRWVGNMFVALGKRQTILTSNDGINWINRVNGRPLEGQAEPSGEASTNFEDDVELVDIAWSGSNFVALGSMHHSKTVVYTSPNGIEWTKRRLKDGFVVDPRFIFWTGENFMITGYVTAVSKDGISWKKGFYRTPGFSVGWNGNYFVSIDYAFSRISADGVVWGDTLKIFNDSALSAGARNIIWTGSWFVAFLNDQKSNKILVSPDGIIWKEYTVPIAVTDGAWSGSRFVVVGDRKIYSTP